jgi:hypothetical protein
MNAGEPFADLVQVRLDVHLVAPPRAAEVGHQAQLRPPGVMSASRAATRSIVASIRSTARTMPASAATRNKLSEHQAPLRRRLGTAQREGEREPRSWEEVPPVYAILTRKRLRCRRFRE